MTTDTIVDATRRQQAESRLLVIRNALTMADEELERALVERDWEMFGLTSFEEYCEVMLPAMKHIKLKAPARRARAKMLLERGATERAIAAATGSSAGTAHNDVVFLTTGKKPGPVLKIEQPSPTVRAASGYRKAAEFVAAAGTRGLTYIELCERSGWRGPQATGALSKAHRRGLVASSGMFRDGCTAYVVPQ